MKYLLKSMQMARSTYYFELSKADQVAVRNHCLADEIKDIFSQHKGRYGVRRVYQELIKRGHKVNHKRVQRLMHTMGLAGKRPKEKYHSYKGEVGKVAENILDRDFSTTAPMQKWTTDVSQFGFSWGKCYLSPILDMNTNEIISYDLSQSANMEQIQRMLAGAFTKFPSVDGLIFHSDQGWQYQHVYFRQALKDHKIIQSMSRKGKQRKNPRENKMDASYKIQRGIHVHLIQFFMCPEFWVHIREGGLRFAYLHQVIPASVRSGATGRSRAA